MGPQPLAGTWVAQLRPRVYRLYSLAHILHSRSGRDLGQLQERDTACFFKIAGFDGGDWLSVVLTKFIFTILKCIYTINLWNSIDFWRRRSQEIERTACCATTTSAAPENAWLQLLTQLLTILAQLKELWQQLLSVQNFIQCCFQREFSCGNAAATQPAARALPQRELDFCRRRTFQPCLCHCQHHHFSLQLRQPSNS